MTKKHLFSRLLNKAVSMALCTKASLCVKSSLLEQSLPRTQSRPKQNQCNLRLKNSCLYSLCLRVFVAIRSTKVYVRKNKLFLQNKPKFRKVKLNVNKVLTKAYDIMDTWSSGKKQSQTNPNKAKFKKAKMNVTSIITVGYENKPPIRAQKKQSQTSKRQKPMQTSLPQRIMKITAVSASGKTNPNKPKRTQLKPIKCKNKPKTNPILARHLCGGSEPIYAAAFND